MLYVLVRAARSPYRPGHMAATAVSADERCADVPHEDRTTNVLPLRCAHKASW
jgi:hypothetical protein